MLQVSSDEKRMIISQGRTLFGCKNPQQNVLDQSVQDGRSDPISSDSLKEADTFCVGLPFDRDKEVKTKRLSRERVLQGERKQCL